MSDIGFLALVVLFLFAALAVTLYALIQNWRQRGLPSTLVLVALVVTATVGLLMVDLKVWYPRALYQVQRDDFARVVELAESGQPFSVPGGLDGRHARVDRSPRGVEIFLPMAYIERGQVYGYGYAHIPGATRGTGLRTAPGQCARWPLGRLVVDDLLRAAIHFVTGDCRPTRISRVRVVGDQPRVGNEHRGAADYDDVVAGYEPVIGLETHVELGTRTKCGCPTDFGAQPNTQICPVCLGLPGSLPVADRAGIEATIRIGLALNCGIADWCRFARKNYFCPDMPRNSTIVRGCARCEVYCGRPWRIVK